MAALEWPEDVCPASLTWRPESNTKTFRSPFNGASQTVRFPGTGTIVLGGYVYYGMGRMGSIDDATETNTTSPTQVKMTLSGLDLSLFAKTLNERCVGRNAEIYLVAMDDNGVVQVADLLFKGKVSGTGATAGETNALQYTISNIFEDWQRPFPDRYTDESQQASYSGDRIFRYVAQMAERSIFWGNKKDAPGFTYK
ncbi:hypothetical protein ACRQPR_000845 [Citrobacter amalonaticus]